MGSSITIGAFDGVHKGHGLLIKRTLAAAAKGGMKSIVIALERPVKNVSGVLSLTDEKTEEIARFGIDEILFIPVPSDILLSGPDGFLKDFLIGALNARHIVCGEDFAFGKNRKGNVGWLKKQEKKYGFKLDIVKPVKAASKPVSSSYIRELLHKGDLKSANKLLGREYSFSGMPFREKGIGKKIGYPTVNIKTDKEKILPGGVYISLISDGTRIYPSVTSIGRRATFNRGEKTVPETHIFDFCGNWKKKRTKVTLIKKLREEKKFQNADELKAQISKDVKKARNFFRLD